MQVPLLDISRQHADIEEELKQVFAEALSTSGFIKGPDMVALEKEFAEYSGTADAIACASGTDALILALQVAGLKRDELVITVPFTFFASAGAIVTAGGTPVFIDILPDTFNMDPDLLEEWLNNNCAITNRGVVHRQSRKRVAAIMPVHIFGQIANMDSINATASTWDLPVIEDAAQAVGAKWRDSRAGSFGSVGCFSISAGRPCSSRADSGRFSPPYPRSTPWRMASAPSYLGSSFPFSCNQSSSSQSRCTGRPSWPARRRSAGASWRCCTSRGMHAPCAWSSRKSS